MEPREAFSFLAEFARMGWWLLAALGGLVFIYRVAPHMAEVVLYKLALAPAAAYVFYRLDCAIGERRRPHQLLIQAQLVRAEAKNLRELDERERALRRADDLERWALHRYLRRTILISAGLIAIALAS
jgi:hypothetical protein